MERGRGGEIYNVGGGEEATMSEAIALAEEIAGRELASSATAPRWGTSSARAPTSRRRRRSSAGLRPPLADGLRAQWAWVAARVAAP